MNAAIKPEINEPTSTKGIPSKISARKENQKFCQLKSNQVTIHLPLRFNDAIPSMYESFSLLS
jgi:hypothetical protein